MKASDPATWKPVPYRVAVPTGGVTLDDAGLFKPVMENNVAYLLNSFSVNHMLVPFRIRAGQTNPPEDRPQVQFWETELRGSSAGRFLMGAGNTLRWTEHPELRHRLNELIDGIEACREPNGYILAYPPDKPVSEEPNYARAWFTHGLIEAAIAGNPKAYGLRGHADWFNTWDMLPKLIYSLANDGLYVNLYAPSTIRWTLAGQPVRLTLSSQFPFQPQITLKLGTAQTVAMKLRVRVPAWAAHDMPITVNGRPMAVGKPGSYVVLDRTWADADTIAFTLPMDFRATRYTGADKIAGHERYALEYGPILMATVGPLGKEVPVQIAQNAAGPLGTPNARQRS